MAAKAPFVTLSSGRQVPVVGLGTWKSEPGKVYEAVKTAIDAGYRHIDCALAYQNEDEIGRAIEEKIKEGVVERKDLWVTSKCWNTFHSKSKVLECCQLSLKRLRLDYLDLYLMHWPFGYQEGGEIFPRNQAGDILFSDVDYLETWEGMEECYEKGLVRDIGLSNFNSEQIMCVLKAAKVKPVMLQVECHPYLNQSQLIEFCKKLDIKVTGYSPLGSPDRPWAKPGDPSLMEEPAIKEIAQAHGKTPAQVLIRYQLERGVIAIPKSVTKERIVSNLDVFDFKLNPEEMKAIDKFNRNHRFLLLPWAKEHKHYPFNIEF
ncbi:aldo-keto reductase family 1 member B1 [Ixodes scapularis]|uniref:aldo-keto reductase family 1 member B1 n=1 Tax=Ixodes scapularis TaxID=6945 RepID=UPI001A9CE800|nr:aldo-keto reductase family 1 member B1 [Ixodes scapularis]XP_029847734.2 aldo-keto reductase family 1 member B1 [Ixodes scapularis]